MTADDLRAFIVEIRAEAHAALARLATVDADALPDELRARLAHPTRTIMTEKDGEPKRERGNWTRAG